MGLLDRVKAMIGRGQAEPGEAVRAETAAEPPTGDRTPPQGDPLKDEAMKREDDPPAPSNPTDSDRQAD
jgi:hypothetical protein